MFKNIYLMLFILLAFSIIGCQKSEIQSHWNSKLFIIDGRLDEWTDFPLNHFEDESLSVGLRNDSSNLYLLLATRNQRLMQTALRSGVKVWFNSDNKKDKSFGIYYIGEVSPENIMPGQTDRMSDEMKQKIMSKRDEMKGKLGVIRNKLTDRIENHGNMTPAVADDIYKGTYLIEIKMPLQKDNSMMYALNGSPGNKLRIGVELGMPKIDKQGMKERPDGGRPPGGRGGMGGGMRPQGGMGGERPAQTNTEIWFSTKLAVPLNEN